MEANAAPVKPEQFKKDVEGQYQEWCRVQYQMAHHDVWWPKSQQMKAASSTLLLLGAVIGATKLLWPKHDAANADAVLLTALAVINVVLGIAYAWNLYFTMVRARERAQDIVKRIDDHFNLLKGALDEPKRNIAFPFFISAIHTLAGSIAIAYFWTTLRAP